MKRKLHGKIALLRLVALSPFLIQFSTCFLRRIWGEIKKREYKYHKSSFKHLRAYLVSDILEGGVKERGLIHKVVSLCS